MTPRQLMVLAQMHRESGSAAGPTRGGQPQVKDNRPSGGGAGWLMAVSHSLERNRPRPKG